MLIVNRFYISITQLLCVIKCYLLYCIVATNLSVSILSINLVFYVMPLIYQFTNHILIGSVYIISGFIGGPIGFGSSIILRLELSLPGFILCSSLQYNSCVTFHGIFMILFMIMPILIGGFGNILLPLMPCSSDMIFPRLNALSLWFVLDSLMTMLLSVFNNGGVNALFIVSKVILAVNITVKM